MNIAAALKRLLRQPWLFTALVGLCGGLSMLALYVLCSLWRCNVLI